MSENQKPTESRFILWRILEVLEKIFCIVPVVIMTVIVFAAVVCRYILRNPIGWSEEITLMCMTWCVFGAASYAFYHGINVVSPFSSTGLAESMGLLSFRWSFIWLPSCFSWFSCIPAP